MPARAVVYANVNTRIGFNGRRFTLKVDQPWEASDPLVKAHPSLFTKQPSNVQRSTAGKVEQATAAPGEKRDG